MSRRAFEFHCANGCGGYTVVYLDDEEDRKVIFECPGCQHKHQRYLYRGEITDRAPSFDPRKKGDGEILGPHLRPNRHGSFEDTEEIHLIQPPKSAFSKTPTLTKMEKKGPLGQSWADRFSGR